jgi:hypothetical protein
MIDHIIEEIRGLNGELADGLSEMAAIFAYDKILQLIHDNTIV